MRLKEGGNRPRTMDDRPRSITGNRQRRKDHGPGTTDHAVQQAIGKEGTTDYGRQTTQENRQ